LTTVGLSVVAVEGVIGEVDHRRLVGGSRVGDLQGAVIGQCVGDVQAAVSRVAFFAVGEGVGKAHFIGSELFRCEYHATAAARTAMQVMWPIVGRQVPDLAVKRKHGIANAARKAPDGGAGARLPADGLFDRVVAEHHIGKPAIAVRHQQLHQAGAVIGEVRHPAVAVA